MPNNVGQVGGQQGQQQQQHQEQVEVNNRSFINLDTAVKLIKEFDGNKKELISEFVDTCDMAYDSVRAEDQELLFRIIRTKITGKARNLIKYRHFVDWDDMKDHLEEIFAEKRSVSHWQLELNSVKQNKGESVLSYSNKIEKYLSNLLDASTVGKTAEESLTISEVLKTQALNVFLQGLQEPLKIHVKSRNPDTLEIAVEYARAEERELLSNKESLKFFGYKVKEENPVRKCYICNKTNHTASSCYQRKFSQPPNKNFSNVHVKREPRMFAMESNNVCFYCKRPNHKISECRRRIFNERKRQANQSSVPSTSGNGSGSSIRDRLGNN